MSEHEAPTPERPGSGRTVAIVVAILLAGAMIAGAILFASTQNRPRVVTTTSAMEAWKYASAGWFCEGQIGDKKEPILLTTVEILAQTESEAGVEMLRDSPVECTEPGG